MSTAAESSLPPQEESSPSNRKPPKKRPILQEPEEENQSSEAAEVLNDEAAVEDGVSNDAKETEDSTEDAPVPKRRGRKRKPPGPTEKYVPDPEKRGIMAGSEAPLRRRDRIKSIARYSPPPHQPSKRGRRSGGHVSFPSTSGLRYVFEPSKSYSVDVKKDETSDKMIIMLDDGSTYKLDATVVPAGSKSTKRKVEEDDDFDIDDDGALDNPDDDEYKPTYTERRNMKPEGLKQITTPVRQAKTMRAPIVKTETKPTIVPTWHRDTSTKMISMPIIRKSNDGSRTTTITCGSPGKSKVTVITTPKSMSLTPAATVSNFRNPPKRNYGSAAKFIDELPEIHECTGEEDSPNMSRLPDKIEFVSADLPLAYEDVSEHPRPYVFRQVLPPEFSNDRDKYQCLLCTQLKQAFPTEKQLSVHYTTQHELTTEHASARFSEDKVFFCLPSNLIEKIDIGQGDEVVLNSPCQYCDDVVLNRVIDLKTHYPAVHNKEIDFISQETIKEMHKFIYCTMCSEQFSNFKDCHQHTKSVHQLHTFICKGCNFFTQDANRLKSHYKAKHMMNATVHNMQCAFCNGLLMGPDRMIKHLVTSHSIQTAINEYSCMSCLEVCGKSDQLLSHSSKCKSLSRPPSPLKEARARGVDGEKIIATYSAATNKELALEKEKASEKTKVDENILASSSKEVDEAAKSVELAEGVPTSCFLCERVFPTEDQCDLHLKHVHTKWVNRNILHDTFLMVQHADGKTEMLPPLESKIVNSTLRVADLPSEMQLDEIGTRTGHGHYCAICEVVIPVYSLYYLHMYNVHQLERQFQCKITACKQTFKTASQFQEHVRTSEHPQKSVIDDMLGAIFCHFCDHQFASRQELLNHYITEEHHAKLTSLNDKHAQRPEPKNHKCRTCHTWFGLLDSFVYHMEHETHKHGCPYCGLHFALPSSRRTHIQSHHIEKQEVCEICAVKQGNRERLFAHLVQHGVVFECGACTKKFYQREQLSSHMESHEDPVDCPWPQGCSKRISQAALSAHIRQHRVEASTKCTICSKPFSNALLLNSHMEVHAKADSNAKAILNSVGAASKSKPTEALKNDSQSTTLISITTSKPGSQNSLITTKRISNVRPSKQKISKSPVKTEIPEGLRIQCCNCSQQFNSQPELYSHKCAVPLAAVSNGNKPDLSIETSLTATFLPIPTSEPVDMADQEKFVLDIAAQLAQSHPNLDVSGNQMFQLELQPETSNSVTPIAKSKPKPKRVRPSQAKKKQQKEAEQSITVTNDQLVLNTDGTALAGGDAFAPGADSQIYTLQQPDGQLVQICIPAGMDMNDVISSLYASPTELTEAPEVANQAISIDQSQQQLPGDLATATLVDAILDGQVNSSAADGISLDNVGQGMHFTTADGNQIFIPMNEDGNYAIDADSLAFLTASSEMNTLAVGNA